MLDGQLLVSRIEDAARVVDTVRNWVFDNDENGPPYDDKNLAEINRRIDRVLLVLDLSQPQGGGYPR